MMNIHSPRGLHPQNKQVTPALAPKHSLLFSAKPNPVCTLKPLGWTGVNISSLICKIWRGPMSSTLSQRLNLSHIHGRGLQPIPSTGCLGKDSLQFKDAGRFPQEVELGCDTALAGLESLDRDCGSQKTSSGDFRKAHRSWWLCLWGHSPSLTAKGHCEALLGTLLLVSFPRGHSLF